MAKYTFYLDMWPGINSAVNGMYAYTHPSKKTEGNKRWAFDVTIPDDVMHEVDAHAPEVSRSRLVDDGA